MSLSCLEGRFVSKLCFNLCEAEASSSPEHRTEKLTKKKSNARYKTFSDWRRLVIEGFQSEKIQLSFICKLIKMIGRLLP